MKEASTLIRFLGYTLAMLVFIALLIEIYSMTTDLNQENFKVTVINVKCLPKSENLEFNIKVSYNGQRILKDFRVFVKLGSIVFKSNSTNLKHNMTVIQTIQVPSKYLEDVVHGNTSLFLGFEFNYDGVIPLKVAFKDLKNVFKFEIEPLKVSYISHNSKYNVTMNVAIVNPLPLEISGELIFSVLNYSETLNVTLAPCGATILNLPAVEISKGQLEEGVEYFLNLVVNEKMFSSKKVNIKI